MYTIEELKKQREDGKITEEQYRQMAWLFCADYVQEHPNEFPAYAPSAPLAAGVGGSTAGSMDEDALKKLIQSEVDRATNKLGDDAKKLAEDNQRLQQQLEGKMTEEERAQAKIERQRQELARREADLADKENRLYEVKAIKAAGLDDGSARSLALVKFRDGRRQLHRGY